MAVAGWRVIAALGGASLALGVLTPWVIAQPESSASPSLSAPGDERRAQGPEIAAAAAPEPRRQGVIAIGDDALLMAKGCLEERGVDVYPRPVRSVGELLDTVQTAVGNQSAVLIHVGTDSGLVDGQITRAIKALGPARRIVWATIQIPDPAWGEFSFEERTNASVRNVVSRHSDGRVLDWNAATTKHPDWTADGTRMSSTGCREYAAKVIKLSGMPRRT